MSVGKEEDSICVFCALLLGDKPITCNDNRLKEPRGSVVDITIRKSMVNDRRRMIISSRRKIRARYLFTVLVQLELNELCLEILCLKLIYMIISN